MLVMENLKEINDVIKNIAGFIQTNEYVHSCLLYTSDAADE